MAQLVKVEGDYSYWDDGSVRYAEGNSLGKQRGGLAKRHPKATTPEQRVAIGLGRRRQKVAPDRLSDAEHRRQVSLDALGQALRTHPDAITEEDGLRMLWAARVEQAEIGRAHV